MRIVGLDFAEFWALLLFILHFIPTIGVIVATASSDTACSSAIRQSRSISDHRYRHHRDRSAYGKRCRTECHGGIAQSESIDGDHRLDYLGLALGDCWGVSVRSANGDSCHCLIELRLNALGFDIAIEDGRDSFFGLSIGSSVCFQTKISQAKALMRSSRWEQRLELSLALPGCRLWLSFSCEFTNQI